MRSMQAASEEERRYIAGFVDGDGSIGLRKPTSRCARPAPVVSVDQACACGVPPELEYIQSVYGGCIHVSKAGSKPGVRTVWQLRVSATNEVRRFLGDLCQYAIVKAPQARIALEYLESDRLCPDVARARLDQAKRAYAEVEVDCARLSEPYLAGIFAADGNVGIYRSGDNQGRVVCSIAQQSCPRLLAAIRATRGCGCLLRSGSYAVSSRASLPFMRMLYPWVVGQKKAQLELAIRFQETRVRGGKRKGTPQEEVDATTEVMAALKRMKRM